MTDIEHGKNDSHTVKIRAAQYLRMSTEHQQYSSDNQAAAIQRYADEHGFEIVATYTDEGRSGVTVTHRRAMLQMIEEVESRQCDFAAILVYDVSRWGRFQNPDEAALYEVRCRWAGVPVHYVAEQFQNDGSIVSSIMKTLKRAMAAEYSRELSAKVTDGHIRMLRRGYHQGGFPCFGLQRVLVDPDGNKKQILQYRERKNIQSDRVILEPGPAEDVAVVNEVYNRYLSGERQNTLVMDLNDRGIRTPIGRPWTESSMRRLLTSECYIGTIVWGKSHGKLSKNRKCLPRLQWIRQERAYPPVVEPALFWKVQAEIERRRARYPVEDVLDGLRRLLKKHGTLTRDIINKDHGTASAPSICRRFGSLPAAYALVGHKSVPNNKYTKINRRLTSLVARLGTDIGKSIKSQYVLSVHGPVCRMDYSGRGIVLMLARYVDRISGPQQWYFPWENFGPADELVIGIMAKGNTRVREYYWLSGSDPDQIQRRRNRDGLEWLQPYRKTDLKTCVGQIRSRSGTKIHL